MQQYGMDYLMAGTVGLHLRRTPGNDELKLYIVGKKNTGRVVWCLAGQNAWKKHAPEERFRSQALPYYSESQALEDALRIYPTRADFDRFCSYGFHGETVKDMKQFGEAIEVW